MKNTIDSLVKEYSHLKGDGYIGWDCGDGWYDLVKPLFEKADQLTKDGMLVEVFQVKEKFGGLRFYATSYDQLDDLIERAEWKSEETCENCGEPGTQCKPGGWIKTYCPSCKKEREQYFKDLYKKHE